MQTIQLLGAPFECIHNPCGHLAIIKEFSDNELHEARVLLARLKQGIDHCAGQSIRTQSLLLEQMLDNSQGPIAEIIMFNICDDLRLAEQADDANEQQDRKCETHCHGTS